MKTKVKICGIRSYENAENAIISGADFLGFNFISTSKRYINPKDAKRIINKLLINNYKIQNKIVGVFQDQDTAYVNIISQQIDLDYVQLHGNEDAEYMNKIRKNIIRSISGRGRFYSYPNGNHNLKYFLLDRMIQGKGEIVDLGNAKELSEKVPLFFAGGLHSENVVSVISQVKPFAVDVASGIERNGVIDYEKMKAFITNAKGVEI